MILKLLINISKGDSDSSLNEIYSIEKIEQSDVPITVGLDNSQGFAFYHERGSSSSSMNIFVDTDIFNYDDDDDEYVGSQIITNHIIEYSVKSFLRDYNINQI